MCLENQGRFSLFEITFIIHRKSSVERKRYASTLIGFAI